MMARIEESGVTCTSKARLALREEIAMSIRAKCRAKELSLSGHF